jgi:hypothetical protein
MAISPSAPDYIGEVRGILNDVRQNYIQKQQLFQQAEQASAQNALAYAQLNSQRENADLQAQMEDKKLQNANILEQMKIEQAMIQNQQGLRQKALTEAREQAKLQFDIGKYENEKSLEQQKLQEEKNAGAYLSQFGQYIANDDVEGANNWYRNLNQQNFSLTQQSNLLAQANNAWNQHQVAADNYKVNAAMPQINSLINEGATLSSKLPNMREDDRAKAIADYSARTSNLAVGLRNKDIASTFDTIHNNLNSAHKLISAEKDSQLMKDFDQMGMDKKLAEASPALQRQYDDLLATTPDTERNTEDFSIKKRRLFLDFNKEKSTATLQKYVDDLRPYEEAQLLHPEFTVTDKDGNVSPKIPMPNLSPSFQIGNLDKDNMISPSVEKAVIDYRNKMSAVGFINPKADPNAALLALAGALGGQKGEAKPGVATQETKPTAQIDMSKARLSNTWAMPKVASTASVSPTVQTAQAQTTPAPKGDANNYQNNVNLLAEVDRQLKAGRKVLMVDGKETNLDLNVLKSRAENIVASQRVAMFGTQNNQNLFGFSPTVTTPQTEIQPSEQITADESNNR